jgi:hypothetical protein
LIGVALLELCGIAPAGVSARIPPIRILIRPAFDI